MNTPKTSLSAVTKVIFSRPCKNPRFASLRKIRFKIEAGKCFDVTRNGQQFFVEVDGARHRVGAKELLGEIVAGKIARIVSQTTPADHGYGH